MHSEDFPALPGTTSTKASCEFILCISKCVHNCCVKLVASEKTLSVGAARGMNMYMHAPPN